MGDSYEARRGGYPVPRDVVTGEGHHARHHEGTAYLRETARSISPLWNQAHSPPLPKDRVEVVLSKDRVDMAPRSPFSPPPATDVRSRSISPRSPPRSDPSRRTPTRLREDRRVSTDPRHRFDTPHYLPTTSHPDPPGRAVSDPARHVSPIAARYLSDPTHRIPDNHVPRHISEPSRHASERYVGADPSRLASDPSRDSSHRFSDVVRQPPSEAQHHASTPDASRHVTDTPHPPDFTRSGERLPPGMGPEPTRHTDPCGTDSRLLPDSRPAATADPSHRIADVSTHRSDRLLDLTAERPGARHSAYSGSVGRDRLETRKGDSRLHHPLAPRTSPTRVQGDLIGSPPPDELRSASELQLQLTMLRDLRTKGTPGLDGAIREMEARVADAKRRDLEKGETLRGVPLHDTPRPTAALPSPQPRISDARPRVSFDDRLSRPSLHPTSPIVVSPVVPPPPKHPTTPRSSAPPYSTIPPPLSPTLHQPPPTRCPQHTKSQAAPSPLRSSVVPVAAPLRQDRPSVGHSYNLERPTIRSPLTSSLERGPSSLPRPVIKDALLKACTNRPLTVISIGPPPSGMHSAYNVSSRRDHRLVIVVTENKVENNMLTHADVEASLCVADTERAAGVVIVIKDDVLIADDACSALLESNVEVVMVNANLHFMLGKALDATATAATLGHAQRGKPNPES